MPNEEGAAHGAGASSGLGGGGQAWREEEIESVPPEALSSQALGEDPFAQFELGVDEELTHLDDDNLLEPGYIASFEEELELPYLLVEEGEGPGRRFSLHDGVSLLGRGIDNEIIIADELVSRSHLRLHRRGARIEIEDLGSGNGSLLNGAKLRRAIMKAEDRITVGNTVLKLVVPSASESLLAHSVAPNSGQGTRNAEVKLPDAGRGRMLFEPSRESLELSWYAMGLILSLVALIAFGVGVAITLLLVLGGG